MGRFKAEAPTAAAEVEVVVDAVVVVPASETPVGSSVPTSPPETAESPRASFAGGCIEPDPDCPRYRVNSAISLLRAEIRSSAVVEEDNAAAAEEEEEEYVFGSDELEDEDEGMVVAGAVVVVAVVEEGAANDGVAVAFALAYGLDRGAEAGEDDNDADGNGAEAGAEVNGEAEGAPETGAACVSCRLA